MYSRPFFLGKFRSEFGAILIEFGRTTMNKKRIENSTQLENSWTVKWLHFI